MAAQTQIATVYPAVYNVPQFNFLSKPPPRAHKKRLASVAPLPAPLYSPPPVPQAHSCRPNAYSRIFSWATNVQPGSPVPWSPRRRLSVTNSCSRRSSISRSARRASFTHCTSPEVLLRVVDTHTPTRAQNSPSVSYFDLTALGYTPMFVFLSKTPFSPHFERRTGDATDKVGVLPLTPGTPVTPALKSLPKKKSGSMKRFRSLSILRPKSIQTKDQPVPPSPLSPATQSAKPSKTTFSIKATMTLGRESHSGWKTKVETCTQAATIAKRKRAKYAHVRPPPSFAQELAMMQFTDGGNMETHIQRVMEAQAKATAGSSGVVGGMGDVYRDEKGGIWWDADEELEYAHLLDGIDRTKAEKDADEMEWEDFRGAHRHANSGKENASPTDLDFERERRPSLTASIDSDLDPKYLLPVPEADAYPSFNSGSLGDNALTSPRIGVGMSVMHLPARPGHQAMHLHKPGFLVDIAAFGPRSPGAESATTCCSTRSSSRPKGKARRRPAPLKLANSAHARANAKVIVTCRPKNPTQRAPGISPVAVTEAERIRREFIESSFAPVTFPSDHIPTLDKSRGLKIANKRSSSMLAVRGLFARKGN